MTLSSLRRLRQFVGFERMNGQQIIRVKLALSDMLHAALLNPIENKPIRNV